MFKILTKSLRPFVFLPLFRSSQKKDHLLALSHQLFTQHQTLKGWKTVRLLHSLTMARYDPEVVDVTAGGKEEGAKLQDIIGSLSGEMHLMPQREVNMLLQVLRERGYSYDRTVPIFKALSKQAKLLFGRQYRAVELGKSLQLYRQLGFPKQTWVKMVSGFLEIDVERTKKEQQLRMSVAQFMRVAILVLEQPYIPLSLVKALIERLVKENANNLDTLTTLYHITRILPNCLKATIDYHLTRNNARELLFNPYTQLQQQEEGKDRQTEEEVDSSAEKQSLRAKLNESAAQILKLFFGAVDTGKLEHSIIKSIQSDIQPLTKQALLFACDIVHLKPTILNFLHENLQKLTPLEFLHLLRKVPAESSFDLLKKYEQKVGKYMNIQERVFFLLEGNRSFRTPITVQAIVSIVDSADTLTYDEFMGIAKLVGELPQSAQQKIPQILAAIKRKVKV